MNHSDKRTTMVAASFVMALISIATFQIFFVSLPCASISIILALISRGDQPLLPRAKAALICAAVAAVLTTSVTVFSVYTVMHDPQLRGQVEQYYNYLTNPEGFTPEQDDSQLQAGLMWHTVSRQSKKYQLSAKVTSFVPLEHNVELMHVEITNTAKQSCTLTPVAAIPIYGRSADNIRDHRHVTSLLHRIETQKNGVTVKPTMSFDERGHRKNYLTYLSFYFFRMCSKP